MKPFLVLATLALATGCSAAEPAETETTTATETVTEEVETVPQSCLDALDHADEALGHAANGFEILADGFDSASQFDVDGINQTSDDMDELNPKMSAATSAYGAARDRCRAAGG